MKIDWKQLSGRVLVSDGAWGTQLQQQGLPAGYCSDVWNVENPSAVTAVARSYVQAGSDVIMSNTLRSSALALEHWDMQGRADELAERGAALSKAVAGDRVGVFASLGPSGKIVMMDQVGAEPLHDSYLRQAQALARGGADAIVCETFTELADIEIAAQAAVKTGLPVILSMTFDSGPDGTATMMGNTPADVANLALRIGCAGVGANCGAGPENFIKIAQLYRRTTHLPLWIKPNAGLPVRQNNQTVFPMNADEFGQYVPKLIQAGATFVGGCCGTTPRHIVAARQAVDAAQNK